MLFCLYVLIKKYNYFVKSNSIEPFSYYLYMKKIIYVLSFLFFILIIGIYARYSQSVETIFKGVERNESELKKVLIHYSVHPADSLKKKAALFLIKNMDAHYSYQSPSWEKLQIELDSLFSSETDKEKLKFAFELLYKKYDLSDVQYISDTKTIKADFLISNIDSAFVKWKSPYAKHLNFTQFCEYLLPYRVGHEPLTTWRNIFYEQYLPELYSRLSKKNADITAIDFCDTLKRYPHGNLYFPPADVPDYNAQLLSNTRLGTCRQYCLQSVLAARCIGMPVVIDFTPQWATRSMGHEWNALITPDGKPLSFGIGDTVKLGRHIEAAPDRIAPKVYRETYAKQTISLAMIHGKEEIPPTLASPCFIDVTNQYYQTVDIPVKFRKPTLGRNKFAYLAVFNNKDWAPVAWSRISNNSAVFKNMNKDFVCLPVYYLRSVIIPAAYPFIISKHDKIIKLKPRLNKRQTIVLSRKYQTRAVAKHGQIMIGGKFQAANRPDFKDARDIYTIRKEPDVCYHIVKVSTRRKFKYFRYLVPEKLNAELAEFEVYSTDMKTKLIGNIIGTDKPTKGFEKQKAFDGDISTSFRALAAKDVWVGLELSNPTRIGKIIYLPVNDDNCIRDGEMYELFYWDNKWISLGEQMGSSKTYRLTYSNVPTNALFLLRNLTKGNEERIFTYKKGKQIWW